MSEKPNETAKPKAEDLRVEIAEDRLSASIVALPDALTKAWPVADLKALCSGAGIAITAELEQTLTDLSDVKKRPAQTDHFTIANGVPPTDAQAPALLFNHAGGMIKKGEAIGQIEPARPGTDGIDVTGAPIAHKPATAVTPALPALTKLRDNAIVTDIDAYLHIDGRAAHLDPVTVLEKFDSTEQASTFDRTMLIRGNVHKSGALQAKRSLIIDGSVDLTPVVAAHDFAVTGIFGRSMARFVVGRNMRAQFVKQAILVVNGNLYVADELSECDVTCVGQVIAPSADIRGGRIHAEAGIDVNSVGNDSMVRTTLEVGLDLNFEKLLEAKKNAIVNGRRHIEQVRMHVAPLMANPKRLTNSQKEKATELLFEADELQTTIDNHLTELRKAMDVMTKRAESALTVRATIYPGTTIRFQGVETTIRSAISGPCRIVAQGLGDKPRIVVFMGTSTTPQVLESRSVNHNAFVEMRKLAA